jgi:multiple sugar transport system substrate-binding protein
MKLHLHILTILVFLFVGCTNNEQSKDDVLRFGCFLNSPSHQKELEALLKEFSQKEGVNVELIGLNWSDGKTKLISAFNSGTEPDVIELGSDWVAQFSEAGVLAKLTLDEIQSQRFLPVALDPTKWNGSYFAVPWVLSTRIMFVNEALRAKAGIDGMPHPQTMQELLEQSAKIKQASEESNYGIGIVSQDLHQVYKRMLPIMWSNGGDILNQKGEPTLDDPKNVEALASYVALVPHGIIESAKQLDKMFIQGKIGFWISGPWLLEKIPKEQPDLKFGLALVPGMKPESGLSFTGGDYLAISKHTNKRAIALKLIQFLTAGEQTLRLCRLSITAGIPADTLAQKDPFFQQIKGFPIFIEQLRRSKLSAVHPKWLDIESAYELAISQAVYGRLSPKQALTEAQQSVQALMSH